MISLPHQKYQMGLCIVNCQDMTVSKGSLSVTLPAKVFEFLKLLLLHAGDTVTKELAIEQVWLGNIEVGKRGTGNAIWQLRKTIAELGEEPELYFKTITKIGYQLLMAPQAIEENTPSSALLAGKKFTGSVIKSSPLLALCAFFLLTIVGYFSITTLSVTRIEEPLQAQRITNFEGVEEQAAISPDGRFMAFQWRRERKKAQIYIKDLSKPQAPLRQVSMSEDKETSPTWSPDGQALAYFRFNRSGQCELHVRELITNQDRLIDTGCISTGYLNSLDWSPDGKWLAYAKAQDDRVAVFTYSFASSEIEQLSFPLAGEEDLLMSWSGNSTELAVVRSVEMDATIMLLSRAANEVVRLIEGESMIIGLEWEQQSNHLYFNALREGSFIVERYDFASQSVVDFHEDDTISSLAINEKSQTLYYSRHISQEHITVRNMHGGQIEHQLASSSRDMFGQYLAATEELLFLSNRSGAWELWLNQESGSKQLTDKQGLLSVPAASPLDKRYVVPMKPYGEQHYHLYLGDLNQDGLTQLSGIEGDVRNPSFSHDGSKVYYSSNVGGNWALYQYVFASQTSLLVVADGAKYGVEDQYGGLYYSKDNQPGIFYHPVDGSEDKLVTADLAVNDWGSFFYQDDALYFLKRSDLTDEVVQLAANNQPQLLFSLPASSVRGERSLAKADNDSIVMSMLGINDADIYSVSLAAAN